MGTSRNQAVTGASDEARTAGEAAVFHDEALSEVTAAKATVEGLIGYLSTGLYAVCSVEDRSVEDREAPQKGSGPPRDEPPKLSAGQPGPAGQKLSTGQPVRPVDPALSVADALAGLEQIEQTKRMLEAVQAILTAHVVSTRTAQRMEDKKSARGVLAETARDVGLHRGLNRAKARRLVDAAMACPEQAPQLFKAWCAGVVDEDKVSCFFEETKTFTGGGRSAADQGLAEVAGKVGVREWRERLQAVSARLEPERAAEKARAAVGTRHVQSKAKPDGLMQLTAVLPGAAGQGVEAILSAYARKRKNAGDDRTPGQIKADLLTGIVLAWARATGQRPPGFNEVHRIRTHGSAAATGSQKEPLATWDDATGLREHASAPWGEAGDCREHAPAPWDGATDALEPRGLEERGLEGRGMAETEDAPAASPDDDAMEAQWALEAFQKHLRNPDGGGGPGACGATSVSAASVPPGIGIQVNLVITDLSLFGITDSPAELFGLGPVPADLARELVAHAASHHAATLKRLYTSPVSGGLVAMESKSRTFPDGLAQMIATRDRFCRHPYCDSAIRHLDHIEPHAEGGATSFGNGQGLCAAHNLIKDANHTRTYPVPTTTRTGQNVGLVSGAGAGPGSGAGAGPGSGTNAGPASRPNEGAFAETVSGPAAGTGEIVTRLASGAEFVSPVRDFLHEDPTTVAHSNFWAGFRAGRGVTDAELTQRGANLDLRTSRLADKKARLDRVRSSVTRKVKELAVDRERLRSGLLKLSCSQDFYDQETQRLAKALTALKEARAELEDMQGDVEITRVGLEDAEAGIRCTRARLRQDKKVLVSDRIALDRDRADLDQDRADLDQDRADLDRDRAMLNQDQADWAAARCNLQQGEAELGAEPGCESVSDDAGCESLSDGVWAALAQHVMSQPVPVDPFLAEGRRFVASDPYLENLAVPA